MGTTPTTNLTVEHVRTLVAPNANTCTLDWRLGGTRTSTQKNMWITSFSRQVAATVAKKYYQAACRPQQIVANGITVTPPADPTFTVNAMIECGGLPELLTNGYCVSHFAQVVGMCDCLDSIKADWEFVIMYENAQPNGAQGVTDDANEVVSTDLIATQPYLAERVYFIGRVNFTEITDRLPDLATQAGRDVIYYGDQSCISQANCRCTSIATRGTEWLAVLSALDADASTLYYTTDSKKTWTAIELQAAGAIDDITYTMLFRIGDYLGVTYTSNTDILNGYVLFDINGDGSLTNMRDIRGVFDGITNQGIRDICVLDDGRLVILSRETYLYVVDNLLTGSNTRYNWSGGVTSMQAEKIACCGNTWVIVGQDSGLSLANGVVYSENAGGSWTAASNPVGWGSGSYRLQAVWMHNSSSWTVGGDNGTVWKTCDKGSSWTLIDTLDSAVGEILFPTSVWGWLNTLDSLYWTGDGGATWCLDTPRIDASAYVQSIDVAGGSGNRAPSMAFPNVANTDISANFLAVVGATATDAGWAMCGVAAGLE